MRRPLALLLVLWLSLLTADLPSLHACAMHGGAAGGGVAHGGAVHGGAVHGDNAQTDGVSASRAVTIDHAHGDHAAASSVAPLGSDAPSDPATSSCQCLGDCCGATVVPLQSASEQVFALLVPRGRASTRASTPSLARSPDLALPFAVGPPGPLTA